MPLHAIARLVQTMLYAQRFFPYYVYNILGGIEEDGKPLNPCQAVSHSPIKVLAPFTPLIPWDPTSARHVVLLGPHNLSYNLSSITR